MTDEQTTGDGLANGTTNSATDDSSVGMGNRDDVLEDAALDDAVQSSAAVEGDERAPSASGAGGGSGSAGDSGSAGGSGRAIAGEGEIRGPEGGPGNPPHAFPAESNEQQHHDAGTNEDTTSGGSAESEAANADGRRESQE